MTKVLYPGSFDPITKGHMDLIRQAKKVFGKVVIAIMRNPQKKSGFFTHRERFDMINKLYKDDKDVEVIDCEGATVDVALQNGCKAIVRGLRNGKDFDFEMTLEKINKNISKGEIETVCLFADEKYLFYSSSIVKEIFNLGKDITEYVDPIVKNKMFEKLSVTDDR